MSKHSAHSGADSHLSVEVSAVRGFARSHDGPSDLRICNDEADTAEAFAVYIRNPLASHVEDFPTHLHPRRLRATHARRAKADAFRRADALAERLGCEVISALPR